MTKSGICLFILLTSLLVIPGTVLAVESKTTAPASHKTPLATAAKPQAGEPAPQKQAEPSGLPSGNKAKPGSAAPKKLPKTATKKAEKATVSFAPLGAEEKTRAENEQRARERAEELRKREAAEKPELTVVFVVDNLRPELLSRYENNFAGGLKAMAQRSLRYADARIRSAFSDRSTGLATLATGTDPFRHGIIADLWIDKQSGQPVFSTDTANHYCRGCAKRQRAGGAGQIRMPTMADRTVGQGGQVYAVSYNGLGAQLLAGKRGTALWFDPQTGIFVSAGDPANPLPETVLDYNETLRRRWDKGFGAREWKRRLPKNLAIVPNDNGEMEIGPLDLGATFPHTLAPASSARQYFSRLAYTGYADSLVLSLADRLIRNNKLAQNGQSDLIYIVLDAQSMAARAWGPRSLEAVQLLFDLDRNSKTMIEDLLRYPQIHTYLISSQGIGDPPGEQGWVNASTLLTEINDNFARECKTKPVFAGLAAHALYLPPGEGVLGVCNRRELLQRATSWLEERSDISFSWLRDDGMTTDIKLWFDRRRAGDLILTLAEGKRFLPGQQVVALSGSASRLDRRIVFWEAVPGQQPRTVYRRQNLVGAAKRIATATGVRLR